MPPSGYSTQQADFISAFLRSCARDLEREALENHCSYAERLTKEIDDIGSYLQTDRVNKIGQRAVLELTAYFYTRTRESNPRSAPQFWAAVELALSDVTESVLAIHIDATMLSKPRGGIIAAE